MKLGDNSFYKCESEELNIARCPQNCDAMLTGYQLQSPRGFYVDQEILEEKQDGIDSFYEFLAVDEIEDLQIVRLNSMENPSENDAKHCEENNEDSFVEEIYALVKDGVEEAKVESNLLNEQDQKPRERHQKKVCGIVYEETLVNSSAREKLKPKPKPWAYYVTDSDIINFIKAGNVSRKWNIDTFVLRELHRDFKVAKKVLYHATMEDAIKTREKFISDLKALLENRATQEQRASLLSNSKATYKEGLADSKLSHFDYRLKVFMEVLRDPQQKETLLLKAKEFISDATRRRKRRSLKRERDAKEAATNSKKNIKSPHVKMETEAPPSDDASLRRKRANVAIDYVGVSRSSPTARKICSISHCCVHCGGLS